MLTRQPHRPRQGFTLIELLVVVAIISMLISILLPSLKLAKEKARTTKCMVNLRSIGQALMACETETGGYTPIWDDGEGPVGHVRWMLTWVDVLYDQRYTDDWAVGICPVDEWPDEPTEYKARNWRFNFVRKMGMRDTIRWGTRTSYAQNFVAGCNQPGDRHKDPTRQIYAIDGWWSWFGSLNAMWVASGGQGAPGYTPNYASAVAWRHTREYIANAIFFDGHAGPVVPDLGGYNPSPSMDDPDRTVDTVKYFTWLPGELTTRLPGDVYRGSIQELRNTRPKFTTVDPAPCNVGHPRALPAAEICSKYKTWKRTWGRLPNVPRYRR